MKKTKKLFGIIAIAAIIGLLFAGCSDGGDSGGGGSGGSGLFQKGNLPAPTGVKAETQSGTSIKVSWNLVSGAMNYYIFMYYKSNAANSDYNAYKMTYLSSTDNTTFTDLSGGATYYFRVAAFDLSGEGRLSSTVSATTSPGVPARPAGLEASAISRTEIQLSWDPVNGAAGYIIEQSTSSSFSSPTSIDTKATSYKITDLTEATRYYFRVRSYNSQGESSNSLSANTYTFFDISSAGTPTLLTMSQWKEDSITTSGGEKWYSFDVIKDTTYYIWWDDSDNSSNTLNARSSAFYSNGSVIFNDLSAGYYDSESFKATSNATVYVRVYPASSSTGTFGIAYNTASTRPKAGLIPEDATALTAGTWIDGTIGTSGEAWYKLIASATTHYLWWNDSGQGNGKKTLDVNVNAYRSNETSVFNNIDSAWSSSRIVSSLTVGEAIYIRVTPKTTGQGTFGITFNNSSSTRPLIPPASPTPLTNGTWADGSINTTTGAESYYSFNAESGTQYYIWWNESGSGGNGFKTSNIDVSVFSSDGAILLPNTGSAWTTSQTITPTANGTIYIRVSSSNLGTFGVVYSTSNTRPVVPMPASTQLTERTWANGSIAAGGEQWFKFTATTTGTQHIFFTWGTLNQITVNVYNNAGATVGSQSSLSSNTRSTSRTVEIEQDYYIRVTPSSSGSGEFKIAFNDKSVMFGSVTTPLTEGTWADSNIASSGEQWFSFTATAAKQYIHASFGTLNGLYIQLYDSSLSTVGSEDQLNNTYKYRSRTVTVNDTYYMRVTPTYSGSGTYKIAFNDSIVKPGVDLPEELLLDTWKNGNLPTASDEQWFKFTATATTQYIHVTFGTLTDLNVHLYDVNWDEKGNRNLYGNTKYVSSTVEIGQVYYIRVTPYDSSKSGTYTIAFNASSTAPN